MRKSSNVRCAIVAPQFTNVKLYQDGYKVTVSLPISERMHEHLTLMYNGVAISYRGRYYIHWEKSYGYDIPFGTAFSEAANNLVHMKITLREAKIEFLQNEIEFLKWE